MWNEEVLSELEKIASGECGAENERRNLLDYLCFYAYDGTDFYCAGYPAILAYHAGEKPNPFSWIAYTRYCSETADVVFNKGDE